jgi:hypothetical protein
MPWRPPYGRWDFLKDTGGGSSNRIKSSLLFIYLFICTLGKKSALVQLVNLLSLELKKSYSSNQQSLHSRTICASCDLTMSNLAHTARSLDCSVQPSWSVWTFLLLVYFSSWVEGLVLSGCCLSLHVSLWIFHDSHAFQGSAKQTLFPFVGCSQGFRLKDLWSKTFLPFTKCFIDGPVQWNLWRKASNRRQLRASNRFTWLRHVPKMFGYKTVYDI